VLKTGVSASANHEQNQSSRLIGEKSLTQATDNPKCQIHGVASGTNEIIKKLKEKYDCEKYNCFSKPDSILDIGRIQKTMELYLLTELEGSEDVYLMGFIQDYCKVRWSI